MRKQRIARKEQNQNNTGFAWDMVEGLQLILDFRHSPFNPFI
jgi:hypothetical protein